MSLIRKLLRLTAPTRPLGSAAEATKSAINLSPHLSLSPPLPLLVSFLPYSHSSANLISHSTATHTPIRPNLLLITRNLILPSHATSYGPPTSYPLISLTCSASLPRPARRPSSELSASLPPTRPLVPPRQRRSAIKPLPPHLSLSPPLPLLFPSFPIPSFFRTQLPHHRKPHTPLIDRNLIPLIDPTSYSPSTATSTPITATSYSLIDPPTSTPSSTRNLILPHRPQPHTPLIVPSSTATSYSPHSPHPSCSASLPRPAPLGSRPRQRRSAINLSASFISLSHLFLFYFPSFLTLILPSRPQPHTPHPLISRPQPPSYSLIEPPQLPHHRTSYSLIDRSLNSPHRPQPHNPSYPHRPQPHTPSSTATSYSPHTPSIPHLILPFIDRAHTSSTAPSHHRPPPHTPHTPSYGRNLILPS
ncbi:hypothetical protein C7M84_014586 [Penaeus vannamei]|uniref:Uncharacterized protein n=1 Tax=Penaeus vannamei TaxID=6689 RepID=A0A3R7QH86_PENVA|nr:hypothetical protein C7M84_014586 [Penaeus vannamei]